MRCCRPHFCFASAKVRTFGTHTKFLAKKFWRNFREFLLKRTQLAECQRVAACKKNRAILRSRAADMTGCARWWTKVLICRWADGRENLLVLCPLAGKSADLPGRRRAGFFMSNGANVGLTCVYAKFWGGYFAKVC